MRNDRSDLARGAWSVIVEQIKSLAAFAPTPIVRAFYERAVAGRSLDALISPHAERFQAATMFADISGFTALTETLARHSPAGAEELMELLNRYFSRMITHTERYGGQVVRLSGDAIIALFAVSDNAISLTRVALNAMYTSVEMQAAMADFQNMPTSIGRASLALKIGIGAGDVFAAHVGGGFQRWEYLIAGDAMEQAADAEKQARPGQVVLSRQVAALLNAVNDEQPDCPDCVVVQGEPQAEYNERPEQKKRQQKQLLRSYHPTPLSPCDWETLPVDVLEYIEALLHHYVPAAILARLHAGQQTWLADLRRMTSLFIGVSGLDYSQDNALDRLQNLMATIQTITYRYEGSLNKVAVDDKGTVLLLLFGAPPMTHEDDPLRALACARELQQMTKEPALSAFRLAIGISTDTVFAGPMGSPARREYTVMGDTVNLASRLMQAAGEGNTLCCHTTYLEARKHWHLEPLPPLQVKGKTEPVPVYRFAGLQTLTPPPTSGPLVGRASEIATLMSYIEQVQEGPGEVVSVSGEGGIGKTRLLSEFMRRVSQETPDLTILAGTAHSLGQQTPYLAWRSILNSFFGFDLPTTTTTTTSQREERVREYAHRLNPDLEIRLPLLNDILELSFPETSVTRGLSPIQRRENLTALLVQLLLTRVRQHPLLVVLDDMHWADSLSWDLALDVARALPSHPLMLVLSYRPPGPGDNVAWGTEKQASLNALSLLDQHHKLPLPPLDEDAVAQLVEVSLDHYPVATNSVSWLFERSQGNPFFVEETVKMLREQAALVLDETNVWQLASEQDFTAIPSTLKGIIQAQLDRLSPNIQLVCKVASVVGRIFPERVVSGVYPMRQEVSNLRGYLDVLAQQNITPLVSREPELRYQFRSALTQEVAYSSLLLAHRQALHQAVAEWYEREYADNLDPYVPLLADHYRHTEQWHRFLEFAERAGQLAASTYATDESLTYLTQAIELLQERSSLLPSREYQERLFALLLTRQEVYYHSSNITLQERDLHQISYLADTLGCAQRQAQVQIHRARYYQTINAYDAAEREAKQALKQAKSLDDRQLLGDSMTLLARNAELRADYHQALWWGFQAVEYYREIGSRQGEAHSLNFLGIAYAELGDYPQAEQYHQQALDIHQTLEDRWGEAASLNYIGNLHSKLARPRDALSAYFASLSLRRSIGDRSGEAFCLLNIGSVYQSLGDMSRAQEYQHEALAIWHQTGNQYGEAMLLVDMSTIAATLGAFETAQQYATEGLAIARTLGNRQVEAFCLLKWANASHELALLRRDWPPDPEKPGRPCITKGSADSPDDPGQIRVAREHYQTALSLVSHLGLRRWEAYALHSLAEWEWEWGDRSEQSRAAADYWERAAAIRQEIGEVDLARASRCRQALALAHLGDREGGHTLAREVWEAWRVNPPPTEAEHEIREAYLSLYQTWVSLGKHEYASGSLAWAYQGIQDRAVRISHSALRQMFLSCVPINLAIAQVWNETMGTWEP